MNVRGDSTWDYVVICAMICIQTEWENSKDPKKLNKKLADYFSDVSDYLVI